METDALRWFQQVADGVTVTEVSQTERTSQPGVSRALARLEAEVGTPLLRRSGRTLRMTHAGAAFKHHVDAMLHQLDDGLAAINQLIDPESGTVTLAFQPSMGTWLIPDLISSFRQDHPGVRFKLMPKREERASVVRARSEVDLELSSLRPTSPTVRWKPVIQEPLWLAVSRQHPLAKKSQLGLAEARDEPFIAIHRASTLRPLQEALCHNAGFEPVVAFEADDLPTVRGFVAAGLGVSIVPATRATAADAETGTVRYLTIVDDGARREIGLAWSTERRLLPAAQLFRKHVIDRATARLLPPITLGQASD